MEVTGSNPVAPTIPTFRRMVSACASGSGCCCWLAVCRERVSGASVSKVLRFTLLNWAADMGFDLRAAGVQGTITLNPNRTICCGAGAKASTVEHRNKFLLSVRCHVGHPEHPSSDRPRDPIASGAYGEQEIANPLRGACNGRTTVAKWEAE